MVKFGTHHKSLEKEGNLSTNSGIDVQSKCWRGIIFAAHLEIFYVYVFYVIFKMLNHLASWENEFASRE